MVFKDYVCDYDNKQQQLLSISFSISFFYFLFNIWFLQKAMYLTPEFLFFFKQVEIQIRYEHNDYRDF